MAHTDSDLFTLIDAYAQASAERERMTECAGWAFLDAHRAMLAARAAVAVALGTDVASLPPLLDDTSAVAAEAEERQAAWESRIDAALTGAGR